jgi:hypothetical protein
LPSASTDLNTASSAEAVCIAEPELHAEFVVIQPTRRTLSTQARMFLERFEREVAHIHERWDER